MTEQARERGSGPLLPIIHGTTSLFLGIGLARFSYSPLIPLLVRDQWYSASEAQMLGGWGLAGYLLGSILMIAAAAVAWRYCVAAERRPLESVAKPLAFVE